MNRTAAVVASFAAVLALIALIVANGVYKSSVSTSTFGGEQVACGSAASPNTSGAVIDSSAEQIAHAFEGVPGSTDSFAGYQAACDAATSARGGLALVFLIGGLLLAAVTIGSLAAGRQPRVAS